MDNTSAKEIELNRDDSIPGLLKDLDAFINHPDKHEEIMASFDQKHCQKYAAKAPAK
jgi:hypothetical protein